MGWKDTAIGRSIAGKQHVRTPEEKALVRRLDLVLMVFGFASQGVLSFLLVSAVRLHEPSLTSSWTSSHQVSGPNQHQQCLHQRDEGGPGPLWE